MGKGELWRFKGENKELRESMAAKGYRLTTAGRGRLVFKNDEKDKRVEAWLAGTSWMVGETADLEELFALLRLAGRQPA